MSDFLGILSKLLEMLVHPPRWLLVSLIIVIVLSVVLIPGPGRELIVNIYYRIIPGSTPPPPPDNPDGLQPLSLEALNRWGGLIADARNNTVIVNGEVILGGFYIKLPDPDLKSKTVVLKIENSEDSTFSNNRMFKIEVNEINRVIIPENIVPIDDGYIDFRYKEIEFALPENFDGKLSITFTRATLSNLRITVFTRD